MKNKNSKYMEIRKHGKHEIVEAVRETPLSDTLTQKEKEDRINMLMHRYGVKLL